MNLGVSGAAAADVGCALGKAAERYHGQIRELIYVFSENDFAAPGPYAEPDDLIAWLADFQARETIERVVLLYVPYIYNSVPEITRIRGHSHRNFPTPRAEKRRLLSLADAAGFGVIDFIDVANEQRERAASQFAPLALYLDHSHLSRLGVELLRPRFAAAR